MTLDDITAHNFNASFEISCFQFGFFKKTVFFIFKIFINMCVSIVDKKKVLILDVLCFYVVN
jgi:hypothetical protein